MSLNFSDGVEEYVNIADIATARFEVGEVWTILLFFRVTTTTDERAIFGKWGTGASADDDQFMIRTDNGATPEQIEIWTNSSRVIFTGDVHQATWYCIGVANDGTGGAGGLKCYIYNMDGTVQLSTTGTHAGNAVDLTSELSIGGRDSGGDEMYGDVDYVCYIQQELTQAQVAAYQRSPYRTAMNLQTSGGNVQYFLKLGMGGINAIDLSGQGTVWTVPGTLTVSDPPPVAPLFGFDVGLPYEVGDAPAGLDIPIAAYHYNHHLGSMT